MSSSFKIFPQQNVVPQNVVSQNCKCHLHLNPSSVVLRLLALETRVLQRATDNASAKISSRNHDNSSTVVELLFQTFVSFNFVELFLKCCSTNLRLYQSCCRTVVLDICLI